MKFTHLLVALALAGGLLGASPAAEACKCIPPTVSSSYNNSSDVVRAQVVFGVTVGNSRWHLTRVLSTYKGCLKPGSWLYVRSGADSASCGLTLKNGVQYLINGTKDETATYSVPVVWANSCGYNKPISQLTKSDRQYLGSRYNCCGKTCACVNGKPPVNCFADPCQVNDCPSGTCESNYCGGCNAEFFDDYGNSVCQPCKSNEECHFGQVCSTEGMCLPTCTTDEECNDGFWCRPTQGGWETEPMTGTCTAYQGEGEYCGGFVPYWWQTQCAPGLICTDFPDFIADAPGKCRQACKSNADCSENQYCGSGGVCRDDGGCKVQKDCGAEGNTYITVKCLGYSLCIEDKCDYKCGFPGCQNLSGVFLGYCDAVLGWANIDGKCTEVSGCDASEFTIFETEGECNETCGFTPSASCDDLGETDFGACQMLLGAAVVNGQCQWVSGCGAKGYTFFDDVDACDKACGK